MTLSPLNVNIVTALSLGAFTFSAYADTFRWTKNGGNDNWTNSSNWSQSGGSGDYPSQKRSSDEVHLLGSFSNTASKFDTDLTSGDKPGDATVEIANLYVETDSGSDDWIVRTGGQSAAKLKVSGSMGFYHGGSVGSFTSYIPIELSSNHVAIAAAGGSRTHFNGQIIGGSSVILNADATISTPNQSGVFSGTLNFNVANPSFTGTLEFGRTKVHAGHIQAFESCTLKMPSDATWYNNNRFTFVDNARVGALETGHTAHRVTVTNRLRVGYNNANSTHTGYFDGSGDLYKVGSGVLTLNGSTSHSGSTFISGGQIKLTNSKALENSHLQTDIDNGLNPNGNDVYLAALSGAGDLALGGNDLFIDGAANGSHSGSISGSGSVTLDESSTVQRLSPNNSYSGGTTLASGTLEVYHTNCLGATSGAFTIGNGTLHTLIGHTQNRSMGFAYDASTAILEVDTGATLTWSGAINDSSSNQTLRKSGAGTLVLSNNANTFPGTLDINAGSVAISSTAMEHATVDIGLDNGLTLSDNSTTIGALTGNGDLNIGTSKTFSFGGNNRSTTYSGNLAGLGTSSFTKVGTGTFTYSGVSSIANVCDLNGGVFVLDGTLASSMVGSVDSLTGTSLEGNGRSNGRFYLEGEISPDTPNVGNTGTLQAGSMFLFNTFHCDVNGAANDKLITSGVFDPRSSTLALNFHNGAPSQTAYIIASYGTLSGEFGAISGLPTGYKLDYAYNDGNSSANVALVQDNTAPSLSSIVYSGSSNPTNANTLTFAVTFSESVLDVDLSDFNITHSGTSSGTVSLTGGGAAYTLTIPSVTGDGVVSVSLKNSGHGITDEAANDLNTPSASDSVTVDNTAPVISLNGGGAAVTLVVGDSWSDPVSVSDNIDSSVSIVTGGDSVNTNVAGVYIVTYDASDAVGNSSSQLSRSVSVITQLENWASGEGLSGSDLLPTADPDNDGRTNLEEFAFDDDPSSSAVSAKFEQKISTVSTSDYFTLTFPVRAGASFSGANAKTATVDGVVYTVFASSDLSTFSSVVDEVTPALGSAMPALSTGWEYRTFRLNGDIDALVKGFMKVEVSNTP